MQRCPAVPIAAKAMARSASARSALAHTMAALLPPSSRSVRAKRGAAAWATARPIPVLPVADTSGMPGWRASASPRSRSPMATCARCGGASPKRWQARRNRRSTASAVSGVFSEGFQMTGSPHTSASAAFHAHTATGKLNAVMTRHGPSGCHVSIMRCAGRSLAMVSPYNCRDRPTAKSQMSIISCTSPRPSCVILPVSSVTSAPRSALCARSSSPSSRTSSPRRGAGTVRQRWNAVCACVTMRSASAAVSTGRRASTAPSMGEHAASGPSPPIRVSRCRRCSRVSGERDMGARGREGPQEGCVQHAPGSVDPQAGPSRVEIN